MLALLLAALLLLASCAITDRFAGKTVSSIEDTNGQQTPESSVQTETPATDAVPAGTTEPKATTETPAATEAPGTAEAATTAAQTTAAPETTAAATTAAPATTETPVTTAAVTTSAITTQKPVTTQAPQTTKAPVTTQTPVTPPVPAVANLFRTQYDAGTASAVDASGKDGQGSTRPLAGYQYNANGFSVISPVYSTDFKPYTQVAAKDSFSLTQNHDPAGHVLSVTFTVDTFGYKGTAGADEWFCVSVTDKAAATPGEKDRQDGLFILLRGTGNGKVQAEPHMDVGSNFTCLNQVSGITVPKENGKEVYTFVLDYTGSTWKISINGRDLTPGTSTKVGGKTFTQLMNGFKDKAYFQITAQTQYVSGNAAADKIAFTVNKYNGATPTGTETAAVREGVKVSLQPSADAPIPSVTINGVSLQDYTVSVPNVSTYNQPLYTASRYFSKYCGTSVRTAATASATGHQIVLTPYKPDGTKYGQFETAIYYKDGNLCLGCANETGAQQVLYTFFAKYLNSAGAKNLTIPTAETYANNQGDNWDNANPALLTDQDKIVRSCYKLESILQWDKSKGKYFTYQGPDGYKQTIAESRTTTETKKNRTTNCVIVGNWVMKDAGFYNSGIYNHTYSGNASYDAGQPGWTTTKDSTCKTWFANNAVVTKVWDENKGVAALTAEGRILPGDIIGFRDHNQTILPNGYAFDGGRFASNMEQAKTGGKFNRWVGPNPCPGTRVGFIVRTKDAG